MSTKSYLFKSANKNNTIIFYNEGSKLRINKFKKNKINLIKSKINKDKKFDLKVIMKKLYRIGTRNILIEGGNDLTINLLKKKIFNIFYLFKSSKKIPKVNEYKEFKGQKMLKQSFRIQTKLKSNFGKDTVILYKN